MVEAEFDVEGIFWEFFDMWWYD